MRLKLLAVLIASTLWAYVDLKQVLDHRKMTVKLEVTDIPPGVALDPSMRMATSITLVGNKEAIQDLDPEDITAVVSLKGYLANPAEVTINPRVQDLPKGVTASAKDVKVILVSAGKSAEPPKRPVTRR
jgi:hypothetical protein